MSKTLVNLTLAVVVEEVQNILKTYPKYPYQQVFTASGLLQDLIAYVLSRTPNKYTVIEETQSPSSITPPVHDSQAQRLQIEHLIHLGIRDVLHIYKRTNCYMPQSVDSPATASVCLI